MPGQLRELKDFLESYIDLRSDEVSMLAVLWGSWNLTVISEMSKYWSFSHD